MWVLLDMSTKRRGLYIAYTPTRAADGSDGERAAWDAILRGREGVNLFRHQFAELRRRRPMADPSTAAARLQVVSMTCDLAGLMPDTRRHSDGPGFDCHDRTGIGCCLTIAAPHVLVEAAKVNVGFRYTRLYRSQPPR